MDGARAAPYAFDGCFGVTGGGECEQWRVSAAGEGVRTSAPEPFGKRTRRAVCVRITVVSPAVNDGRCRTSHTAAGVVVYARVVGPVQPTVTAPRLDRGRHGQGERAAAAAGRRQTRQVRQTRVPRSGPMPAGQGHPGNIENVVGDEARTGAGRTEPDARVRRARDELLHRRRRTFANAAAAGRETLVDGGGDGGGDGDGSRATGEKDQETFRHRNRFVTIVTAVPDNGKRVRFLCTRLEPREHCFICFTAARLIANYSCFDFQSVRFRERRVTRNVFKSVIHGGRRHTID